MTTPKQTVHDWSSGSLVEYETDAEPAPETIPRVISTDETPTPNS